MKNKELNLCKNCDLCRLQYSKKCIIDNLKCLRVQLKCMYERSKYGVSRVDSWDFDHYLLTVIENGLKFLKDAGNSYPGWCTEKEWENKLEYMIKLSELSNLYEDEVTDKSFNNYLDAIKEYGKDSKEGEEARDIWLEDTGEFENTKDKAKKKLLNEIEKYINDLWD